MQSDQESIYQASRMVEGVVACLLDYASFSHEIELFDVMELIGRLDLAVGVLRRANGAQG
jgi:hypothetical protein